MYKLTIDNQEVSVIFTGFCYLSYIIVAPVCVCAVLVFIYKPRCV